jgi:hypothetical protein
MRRETTLRIPRQAEEVELLRWAISLACAFTLTVCHSALAQSMPAGSFQEPSPPVRAGTQAGMHEKISSMSFSGSANGEGNPSHLPRPLIVIGFMGGRVRPNSPVHPETSLVKDLQQRYPRDVHAQIFANRNGHVALKTILHLLDEDRDGRLSAEEKDAARIIIFGHSWGASETVALARRLNKLSIPVLLTVQVDSVQKTNQNDGIIPPNVREAVNFYQSDGLLHGRSTIEAMDPARTTILGNYESSYRENPVSCAGFPWYARMFMKPHIEIENDPSVWSRVEALILAEVRRGENPLSLESNLLPR